MHQSIARIVTIAGLLGLPALAAAQDTPFECDNRFQSCGTPEMSGGGGGGGGGGSILIANTDLGDTYQSADDYDNDGIEDSFDNCPRVANIQQIDGDGDGVGDGCDNCLAVPNEIQFDLDGDRVGDACDPDLDGDGLENRLDNCAEIPNPTLEGVQPDLDGDGLGDACDDDLDGDGIPTLEDPCPMNANIAEPRADQIELCFPDRDGDGVGDLDALNPDNCLNVHNPEQFDLDEDGVGDACDPDIDADDIPNLQDNCPALANPDQIDLDRDGVGDLCDTRFCYTVFGDVQNCLDPTADFQVYAPSLLAQTGESVRLRVFANRENQAMNYTWRVVDAPKGSSAVVSAARGAVAESSPFEYRFRADATPRFVPDEPGEYTLELHVETLFEDEVSRQVNATATHQMRLVVEGEPQGGTAGGCSSAGDTPAGWALALLALLGLRRRD